MLDKIKYVISRLNRWHIVLFIILLEVKPVPLFQRGFYCNDPALSHPFTGDTISWKWLIGITVLLPLVIMLIVERLYNNEEKDEKAKQRALQWYKDYCFGFLINLGLVQGLKVIVGSPRPHFFDTCSPNEALTCKESEYVASYTCTKAHWLNQSDKSFPSGHTSCAVHAAVFIVCYLHQRARSKRPISRRILYLQATVILSAIYCAISRMTDHRHHWWDVLAGTVISVPILYFTIITLCRNFECKETRNPTQSNGISESNTKLIDT